MTRLVKTNMVIRRSPRHLGSDPYGYLVVHIQAEWDGFDLVGIHALDREGKLLVMNEREQHDARVLLRTRAMRQG